MEDQVIFVLIIINDDGDENSKNPISLDWQNNNFARTSCSFVHFLAVFAQLQRESA